MNALGRVAVAVAGILGASGVAAAAASSHAGAALLGPYALIALSHAPALLALATLAPASRIFTAASLALMVGATLFCADLAARHFFGASPLPLAAPLGGMMLIAGWIAVTLGALIKR